ncbi:glycoside hydrolase [Lineolata rhizophorae]|uniref:AA9 family lytic polysaccharide monooxygenase n=1 Tax=Lineolata rhizophorae TaxID=578093 RepID=A0A6A6P684_9PEZI|nr:glycoside hydrolase [Lineolata rhizophorae]
MKTSASIVFAMAAATSKAHSIFQAISVDGENQGELVGVRAPSSNFPIMDVTSKDLECNTGLIQPVSTDVVEIPAGADVGALWGHVIGGAQVPNDPDNPIAKSHHGPTMVYMAAVDDAGSAETSGLDWFKIFEDGMDEEGVWGVDRMVADDGWVMFTMPECLAAGDYIMRVEIIALHSAYDVGQAQFYNSCANVRVTGDGTNTGGETVKIPGVYSAEDPGIHVTIYDEDGNTDMDGQEYQIPGPEPMSC